MTNNKILSILTNEKTQACGVREYSHIVFGWKHTINLGDFYNSVLSNITVYNTIVLQFHPHSMSHKEMIRFIDLIKTLSVRKIIVIHDLENMNTYVDFLHHFDCVVCTNSLMVKWFPTIFPHTIKILNVKYVPMPIQSCDYHSNIDFHKYSPGENRHRYIVQHGFPGSEKRFEVLINALPKIHRITGMDVKCILLACADNDSRREYVERFKNIPDVKLYTEYHDEQKLLRIISAADFSVFFYNDQPSIRASLAVSYGFAAKRPVILSNSRSFEDYPTPLIAKNSGDLITYCASLLTREVFYNTASKACADFAVKRRPESILGSFGSL